MTQLMHHRGQQAHFAKGRAGGGGEPAKVLFSGSQKAYHCLSRYTHRVAISNHRLVSLAGASVR
jgi:hypothetical protein